VAVQRNKRLGLDQHAADVILGLIGPGALERRAQVIGGKENVVGVGVGVMVFTVWFLLVMSLLLLARRKDSAHQAAREFTGDAPPDPLGDGLAGVFVGDGLHIC